MATTDLGIDLGTVNIRIYAKGKGVVLQEPSIAAYDKDSDRYIAYGEEARQIIGHASGNIVTVRPFRHGSISEYAVLEEVLRYFIQKAMGKRTLKKPNICLCMPNEISEVEKRAIEEASYQAGARQVTIVSEAVAAAIGAGIDITKPCGNMVVDVGGGSTKIALISIGSAVNEDVIKVGGKDFDDMIMRHIRRKHSMFINEAEAEHIKKKIGSAYKRVDVDSIEAKGRNVITGLPCTVVLTQDEIRNALHEPTEKIVEAVHSLLERTPPELAADIVERGIVLTGGASQLYGLEELIEERTGINVMTAEDPALCVAKGTGCYTEMMELFGK